MTHTLMNQKRIHACERIETLDGEPIVGQRCKLRLWNGDQYTDIHTSAVTDWWCGYPYAIGEIRIETRNTIYCGQYVQEEVYA